MDTPLIVAVVAGCTSIISAVMAWKQALRTKKLETETQEKLANLTSNTQIAIEKLKSDNDSLNKAFINASEEAKPLESILSNIWEKMQEFKDELRKLCELKYCSKEDVINSSSIIE